MKNVNEILVEHGLDFTIHKVPLLGLTPTGEQIPSPYFGLLNDKTNKIIHTVKEGYTISQNDEVVEMVLKGIENVDVKLDVNKAGALNDGRKVFMQLAVEGDAKVGNDTIKRYITIIDSNDGSTGLSVGIGNLTMSCANQFYKFNKRGQFKFRHTATLTEKIKTIPMLVRNALEEDFRLIQLFNKFQSTKASRELAHKLVNHLTGVDKTMNDAKLGDFSTRKVNAMESLYNNIETEMNGKGNSMWGLFSGVTRWTTHEKSAPRRENGRIESQMIGTNYRTNIEALEFLTELV